MCLVCLNKKVVLNSYQVCPISLQKSFQGMVLEYDSKLGLDALIVSAPYDNNKYLEKLIKRYKYFFGFDVAWILAGILKKTLQDNHVCLTDFTFTDVPLHWRRKLYRGFNLTAFLAKEISSNYQVLLKRTRHTDSQAKLNKKMRKQNILNAFSYVGDCIPKNVCIVDDVASSLSTLSECSKVLKDAGVENVYGLVLARNI